MCHGVHVAWALTVYKLTDNWRGMLAAKITNPTFPAPTLHHQPRNLSPINHTPSTLPFVVTHFLLSPRLLWVMLSSAWCVSWRVHTCRQRMSWRHCMRRGWHWRVSEAYGVGMVLWLQNDMFHAYKSQNNQVVWDCCGACMAHAFWHACHHSAPSASKRQPPFIPTPVCLLTVPR